MHINYPRIVKVAALEVLDSRGMPTVEATVYLEGNIRGVAMVPSGASLGSKEACELRDLDKRYLGKGVLTAVAKINTIIAEHLIGQKGEQALIDNMLIQLDATQNKNNLGANAILAVSLALAKAVANANGLALYQYLGCLLYKDNYTSKFCLPVPLFNIINGGAHADNNLDFQEFMLVPAAAPSFAEALRFGVEITWALKLHLKSLGLVTAVGDEGGFAPNLTSNAAALDLLMVAINDTGLIPGKDVYLALDIAASEFYQDGLYHLEVQNKALNSLEFIHYLQTLVKNYPIISIEDGLDEADIQGWQVLTQTLGNTVQLVGDDLFVTNQAIFTQGVKLGIANAILIKPNQIGTLSETLSTINAALENNYSAIISHRSGETEDTFIADLAVGVGACQIKAGALCRSERVAKYNQLLRIAALNPSLAFAGVPAFAKYIN